MRPKNAINFHISIISRACFVILRPQHRQHHNANATFGSRAVRRDCDFIKGNYAEFKKLFNFVTYPQKTSIYRSLPKINDV